MSHHVIIKEDAKFFIERLDKSDRIIVNKAIASLKEDPHTKGKFIGSLYSGIVFYEKRIMAGRGIRIYYSILPERIVIDLIKYEGTVNVHRAGNKKTQKKDINKLKRV